MFGVDGNTASNVDLSCTRFRRECVLERERHKEVAKMQKLQSPMKYEDILSRIGPLMRMSHDIKVISHDIKAVVFFDDFSSGLGKWKYGVDPGPSPGAGVELKQISGNQFVNLYAPPPSGPLAFMYTDINVSRNINYTLTFKINGAAWLYINTEVFNAGSGRYDGTLSGFRTHTQTANSGDRDQMRIMFMAYGHNFAVDDVELKN